ncbi:f-box domain-containing protein [Fusarium mundagurra]|uniref:F-box domain-containing protein n=1 Tax=Fusarium mundagurra TaxID=1567541 RepID=A0A8H5XX99_9HYPO|nr:f-box domain-containing protein [Fusarium mundagurra]
MSASPEPFTLFHKFPPELKLDILSFCSRNDLVCLSLTGPEMRNLVTPLIPRKPNLTWVDQLGPTPDVPSECPDTHRNNTLRRRGCVDARDRNVVYSPMSHRFRRHDYRHCEVLMGGKRCEKHQTTIGVAAKAYPMEIAGGENGVRMGLTTRHISPKTPEDETQESFNRVVYSKRDLVLLF